MNILTYLDGSIYQSNKVLLYDMHAGIGDILWRTCLFKEIKRRNPKLKLYVSSIGNYWKLMLQNNPYVDLLVDKIGQPPYISGVDHYVSDQKCPHVISSYSRELDALDALEVWAGFEIRDKSYVYEVTEDEQKWADNFLSKYPRPIVGVQLKSSTWIRTLPPETVIKLIKMLRYNGITVAVMDNHQFGFKDEGIINLCSYNIREIASIISRTDLNICPDSGLMHFSCHFKKPTIAIFGGSDYKCRTKYYNTVYPITANPKLDCQYCWSHSHMCPKGIIPSPCMSVIMAEEIFEVVGQIL